MPKYEAWIERHWVEALEKLIDLFLYLGMPADVLAKKLQDRAARLQKELKEN